MKPARRRVDVNLDELNRVLDGARQAPLSEADHDKLKGALHALAAMLAPPPEYGEDQRRAGKSEGSETGTPPDGNTPHHPDTDTMEQRRLTERRRWRSRTRS